MVDDDTGVMLPAAQLEHDRKWLEKLLAQKDLGPQAHALLLKLMQAQHAAVTGDNELRCSLWALSAVLVYLDQLHPAFRALNARGLLKQLHKAVQDYGAGTIAALDGMRGEMPDNRTNAAAPSEARERAKIAWCVHRLALGGPKNGAFTVNEAAREVSKYLEQVGLTRTFLSVRTVYYAVRPRKDGKPSEDAEAASWFKTIAAETATNPPGAEQHSNAERLRWLYGVTSFHRPKPLVHSPLSPN